MIDKELILNKNDFIKNNLINSLNNILKDINNNNIDNSIIEIKNILDSFNEINERNINLEENIINNSIINTLIDNINNTKHYKLNNSSFKELENYIRNGLITIGAESSVGKTAFATQISLDLLENNNDTILAFYSLDDSKFFLLKKMIDYLVKKHNLLNKNYKDKELIEVIKNNSLKLITSNRIAIFDNFYIYNLYPELLKFKQYIIEKSNIKKPNLIVVIDYLQIINHESTNLREGLNNICKELKNIQKKLNCIILLISQFNRSTKENNINTLTRYRETSEIENVSDLCINLEAINLHQYNTKIYIVKNKAGKKDEKFLSFRNGIYFNKLILDNKKNIFKKLDFNDSNDYNEINDNIEDLIF